MTTQETLELVEEKIEPQLVITKYEYVRMIGFRAEQLSKGLLPTIPREMYQDFIGDPVLIAKKEVDEGMCPVAIIRKNPDGTSKRIIIHKGALILDY